MNNAWEVTDDDINQVLDKHGVPSNSPLRAKALEVVDHDVVYNQVMNCTDIDEQANVAIAAIEEQLVDAEIIAGNAVHEKSKYEVVVGNIGTVYSGNNGSEADSIYDTYVKQSLSKSGRAGNETVTMFFEDAIEKEHLPDETSDF
jgi:hypothetical protein